VALYKCYAFTFFVPFLYQKEIHYPLFRRLRRLQFLVLDENLVLELIRRRKIQVVTEVRLKGHWFHQFVTKHFLKRRSAHHAVTTFLEFLETWKRQGIRLRSGKSEKGQKSGKGQRNCVVRELLLWQLNKITYLYIFRTVIHFSYVIFTENFD